MHQERWSRHADTHVQLPLVMTSLEATRDEARRNEIVALLATLLLQVARASACEEATDDAS